MDEIVKHRPDIIISSWIEEIYNRDNDLYTYMTHEFEATWLHGKVFRRMFLQSKNIRFHEELFFHEDSYFLAIAFAHTDNVRKILLPTYVWRYKTDSITRCNDASYTFDSMPGFMGAIDMAFQELEKMQYAEMQYKVVQFIIYIYFVLHQPQWLAPERKAALKKAEAIFSKQIKKFMKYYDNAASEFINMIYNLERSKLFAGLVENEILEAWIKRICRA